MIARMILVKILALNVTSDQLISSLYDFGRLHIIESVYPQPNVSSCHARQKLEELSHKISSLLNFMKWNEWENIDWEKIDSARKKLPRNIEDAADEIDRSISTLNNYIEELSFKLENLHQEYLSVQRYRKIASHFMKIFEKQASSHLFSAFWIENGYVADIENEIKLLSPFLAQAPFYTIPVESDWSVLALSIPSDLKEKINIYLKNRNISNFSIPANLDTGDLEESFANIIEKDKTLPSDIDVIKKEISRTSREWGERLARIYIILRERLDQLDAIEKASSHTSHFQLMAWIPEEDVESLVSLIKNKFQNKVLLYRRTPEEKEWDEIPIRLLNNSALKPFELFLSFFSLPAYGTIDPTLYLGIFFPLFFGVMVGDAGYGILMLVIARVLIKRNPSKKGVMFDIGMILQYCSIWAIIFGFLFGEFFGHLGYVVGLKPLWVDRTEAVMPTMIFTVSLGLAHITLGLIIGAVNSFKRGHHSHFWEKISLLTIILAILYIVLYMKSILPKIFFSTSVIALIVAIPMLVVKGGFGALVESLGIVGNILSYVRIMAIGLASAVLAVLATKFYDIAGAGIVGIIIALLIHLLNFALALAGPTLHSARLHYVEFFNKFYEQGKKTYKPFKRGG